MTVRDAVQSRDTGRMDVAEWIDVLTVTPNPAWDVTYPVDRLRVGESIRVTGASARAGGKGINVARVVGDLGGRCLAVAPVGGMRRRAFKESLAADGVPAALVEVSEELRQSVAVVPQAGEADDAAPTLFNESGETLSQESWQALIRAVGETVAQHRPKVVVISGSMPPGTKQEHLAALVQTGRGGAAAVLVDTSGEALRWAVRAGADLVKPNRSEALAATGTQTLEEAAEVLRGLGARQVLITDGGEGMRVFSPDGMWRARPAQQVAGNPTGAGDAALAALALSWDESWPERLRTATAASAAAVAEPVAGQVDPGAVVGVRRSVEVEEMS